MKLKLLPVIALTMAVACEEIAPTSYQKPIDLDKGAITMIGDGESSVVTVTSQSPWTIRFADGVWLTANKMSGDYTDKVVITAAQNSSKTSSRIDTVFFKSNDVERFITVEQEKYMEYVTSNVEGKEFGPFCITDGLTQNIDLKVVSNSNWEIECPDWMTPSMPTGKGKQNVTITVDNTKHNGSAIRTAKVVVKTADESIDFTVLQKPTFANTYVFSSIGKKTILAGKPDGSEIEGIAKADWIFSSAAGMISDVAYADGKITFNINSNDGGYAEIALMDASNKVLWTNLIWITKELEDVKVSPTMTLLDRNIGAWSNNLPVDSYGKLSVAEAYGCFFQWGRPCAFPGPASGKILKDNTIRDTDGAFTNGTWPVEFNSAIASSFTTGTSVATDLFEHPTEWQSVAYSSTYKGTQLWNTSKTIYDPCPAGYVVTPYETWTLLINDTATKAQPFSNGYSRTYSPMGDLICFPSMHYRVGATGVMHAAGRSAGYWSSELESATKAYRNYDFKTGSDVLITGFGVRCMRIEE